MSRLTRASSTAVLAGTEDWFLPTDDVGRIAGRTGRDVDDVRAALRRLADERYREAVRARTRAQG